MRECEESVELYFRRKIARECVFLPEICIIIFIFIFLERMTFKHIPIFFCAFYVNLGKVYFLHFIPAPNIPSVCFDRRERLTVICPVEMWFWLSGHL